MGVHPETDPVKKAEKREKALKALAIANLPENRAKANARKREVGAERTNFRKLARLMLEASLPDNDAMGEELRRRGFKGNTYQSAVILSQLKRAAYDGDTEAAKFVRDSAGFKPTEALQVGNLDDAPFVQLNLENMSSDELRAMIAAREKAED